MASIREFTLKEIAQVAGGKLTRVAERGEVVVRGVQSLQMAQSDMVTWISGTKHSKNFDSTEAAAIIGSEALLAGHPRGIVVADPEAAVAKILDLFDVPAEAPGAGIHPQSFVHPSAQIDPTAHIGAFAVIHADCRIGAGTIIHEGVSLGRGVEIGSQCTLFDRCVLYDRTVLGNHVILHAGVVVGGDGFGYIFRDGKHRKLAHIGNVIIEDDVEVGPNSVIDRGKLGPTLIGRGSKIDALVMIGHNVHIGPLCLLAAQAGLSGSVRLGTGVALAGQSGVVQSLSIGDQVQIGAQAGVISSVDAGETVIGFPARNSKEQFRDWARVRRLQKFYDEVAELSRRVKALEAATDHRKHG